MSGITHKNKKTRFTHCHFPFEVRYTQTKLSISRIGIDELAYLETRPKEEQLLFYYNVPVIVRKRGKVEKVVSNSRQTVCVIDFDKCSKHGTIKTCFERFRKIFKHGSPLLVNSYSGYHVIFVVDSTLSPDSYRDMQLCLISCFFLELLEFIDFTSSVSPFRGFYHSKNISGWIKEGIVNPTPTRQGSGFKFFSGNLETSKETFREFLSTKNLMSLREKLLELLEINANDASYFSRYRWVERYCATRLRRILVETNRTGDKGVLQGNDGRKTRQESAPSDSDIKSNVSLPSISAKAVCDLSGEMGERTSGRGEVENRGYAGGSRTATEPRILQRSSEKGCGCCDFYNRGSEGDSGTGFCGFFGPERILAFVQDVRVLCDRRKIDVDLLGNFISENCIRSNGYWSLKSEESDFSIFFGIVRQILEETYGFREFTRNTSKCVVEWFRLIDLYMANQPTTERILQTIAYITSRGFRLYLKAQGIRVDEVKTDYVSRLDVDSVPEVVAQDFLKELFPHETCAFMAPELDKTNVQTLNRIYREEKGRLILGIRRFVAHLKPLLPLIAGNLPVDIGVEEFKQFFDIHIRAATSLRRLIMPRVSTLYDDFIPTVKRKSYKISLEALICRNFIQTNEIIVLPEEEKLVEMLGSGNTWETIRKYTRPSLIKYHSKAMAEEFWFNCIDKSSANEKNKRKKEVSRFLEVVESQLGVNLDGNSSKLESRTADI